MAYYLFVRRDFTSTANDGSVRRVITFGILPLVGLFVVSAGLLAAATGATDSGITLDKVQQSLATDFANIYPLQYSELYHGTVTAAQLRVTASCTKGGGLSVPEGPGDDWRCLVYWHIPGVNNATAQAVYQLDMNPNGRYVADGDGPTQVNGYFIVHTPYGDASNPLWQFDGNVDLLAATSKG
jgi:ABC-2 type transport system permease protein